LARCNTWKNGKSRHNKLAVWRGVPGEKNMADSIVDTRYSGGEELVNALTHAFGVVLSVVGFTILIVVARLHGGVREIASCAVSA
jgi:predicted membrane channel-forming protein YqfA (hemolysin III family)